MKRSLIIAVCLGSAALIGGIAGLASSAHGIDRESTVAEQPFTGCLPHAQAMDALSAAGYQSDAIDTDQGIATYVSADGRSRIDVLYRGDGSTLCSLAQAARH
jgi:hypothetical protein